MTWSAADVLTAWESASGLPPARRTAVLLCAFGGAADVQSALDQDVGTAAALLLATHAAAFGPTIDVVSACPACGATLEAHVVVPPGEDRPTTAHVNGFDVRLPTLRELDEVHGRPDAGVQLRRRCVTRSVRTSDVDTSDAELDSVVDALAGAAAWHGEVECPECAASFDTRFDPSILLWDRVRSEAPRLLDEVAALASAFGWTESEILALSDARRGAYLALVGAP